MPAVFRALIAASLAFPFLAASDAPSNLSERLEAISARLPEFEKRLAERRSDGQDVAYPLVTFTVLKNFTGYMREDLGAAVPNLWGLKGVSGCSVSYEPSPDARGGKWAAKIVHTSPRAGNVYGMFENSAIVALKPGQTYTLSVWAKLDDGAALSIPLDAGWNTRLAISKTAGKWQRFTKTFQPAAGDAQFRLRVLSEEPTRGAMIDDLCLVEGSEAESGKNLIANGGLEDSWSAARVARELPDMEKMADRLAATLKATQFQHVPRWSGDARPTIRGPSFLNKSGRPVFFVGYGHFLQVRSDIEKFPGYGINIVQHGEMGPAQVFPKENEVDERPVNDLIDELDRAEKAGVAVDFLISPHYVPDWIFAKYPHLRKTRIDFFPYSIYAPEGRALVKRFVDHVMPRIKDKPALLSVCLSNEPINWQEPDEFSTAAWRAWLKQRHDGDVATLNSRWKTTYKSFDEIKQPSAADMNYGHKSGAAWCDFARWNQEYFAQFHKDLADMVHALAPNVPVHAKSTTWQLYRAENIMGGNDPTLLGAVSDINGNDSVNLWSFKERGGDLIERGTTDFAQGWRENALAYELQRSVHDAPVFNSENHFIFDRETRWVDAAHVRAGLWMGAIHGQSATTLWVWARETSNPSSDFAGDIMERPACAEACGIVCHDLNRAADEITAIQNAPYDVRILQSATAAVWDGKAYDGELVKIFTALSFTGLKIGFVTETQLERGKPAEGKLLIVPNCVHLSEGAFKTLQSDSGRMVFVGKDVLTRNEYDQPRAARIEPAVTLPAAKDWRAALESLAGPLRDAGIAPAVIVRSESGKPGVQWQSATTPQGLVVNLYNAVHDPMTVSLGREATDVLTGEHLAGDAKLTLASMQVRLLRLAAAARP